MDKIRQFYELAQIRPDAQKLVPVYHLAPPKVSVGKEVTLRPAAKRGGGAGDSRITGGSRITGDSTTTITVVYI